MTRKIKFHSIDFFRKIRDKQASILAGMSPAEIVCFFSPKVQPRAPNKALQLTRQKAAHR